VRDRVLPAVAACLLLLPLEAALVRFLGLSGARADVALCAVLWLATGSASIIEGAFGAFLCGALADVLYGVHPGLFALLSVLIYVVVRLASGALNVHGPLGFAALCSLAFVLEGLASMGLLSLAQLPLPATPWPALLGGAALTALFAPALYLLLGQVSQATRREDSSLFR
jgi:cell shape-determining protein MreD